MMRITLIILLGIVLFSCKKEYNNNGPQNPIYHDTIRYDIIGLSDTLTIEETDTLEVPVLVNYLSGTKEKVTLMVANLPVSMTAGISAPIDTPTYYSLIRIVSNNADIGFRKISVVTSCSKYSKVYDLVLKVVPDPVNPAATLIGQYAEAGACVPTGNVNDTVSVSVINSSFNKIRFRGLRTGGSNINLDADIDPVTQTIYIPAQQVGGQTFSGTGSYSGNQISLGYSVTAGPFTENCSTTLTRF